MKILVTGSSGFIGYHLVKKLCENNFEVIGIDNHNDYYDIQLKESRKNILDRFTNFKFYLLDISNKDELFKVFEENLPDVVINLAAQAGVRYSIENPYAYVDSNLIGFMNILESCRNYPVKHLLYASSSSVYGGNSKIPFSTEDNVDHPVSLYAATKKSNELLAHSYSHLYKIPTTGLRFFTVYGPYGRPDMAYFSFTKNIVDGNPIKVFNNGEMRRDFTYIDDIIEGIFRLISKIPQEDKTWCDESKVSSSSAPYKIYNLGNNKPESLMDFIKIIENNLDKKADKIYLEMQMGDVKETFADVSELEQDIGFKPVTPLSEGIKRFIKWYKSYYNTD